MFDFLVLFRIEAMKGDEAVHHEVSVFSVGLAVYSVQHSRPFCAGMNLPVAQFVQAFMTNPYLDTCLQTKMFSWISLD